MTRDYVISCLTDNMISCIHSGHIDRWIRDVLQNGYPGYYSLSNDDLLDLYREEIDDTEKIEITD